MSSEREPLIPKRAFGKPTPHETEHTQQYTNDQLQYQTDQTIRDQDQALDALSKTVQRTKEIAIAIGNETDSQNALIDDINTKVDKTSAKVKNTTKRVEKVQVQSSAKVMWVIICILLLGLITVTVLAVYL